MRTIVTEFLITSLAVVFFSSSTAHAANSINATYGEVVFLQKNSFVTVTDSSEQGTDLLFKGFVGPKSGKKAVFSQTPACFTEPCPTVAEVIIIVPVDSSYPKNGLVILKASAKGVLFAIPKQSFFRFDQSP